MKAFFFLNENKNIKANLEAIPFKQNNIPKISLLSKLT